MIRASKDYYYVPAIRDKQGEYAALRQLPADVADRLLPQLVMLPLKEHGPDKGRLLTPDEFVHESARRISVHWPLRELLLDPRLLFTSLGEPDSYDWLARMFDVARSHAAYPIPVIGIHDVISGRAPRFRSVLAGGPIKIAIRVESGSIDDQLSRRLSIALTALGLDPQDCVVIADFHDADLSEVTAVPLIVQAACEQLQACGRWRSIVFQGTNYPEKNPAAKGGSILVPRNEWRIWKDVRSLISPATSPIVFGDYGADCAIFNSRGGRAIPHYRYATEDDWLVVRGSDTGSRAAVMKDVCRRILESGNFAGRSFSWADNYIYETVHGLEGPGNPTTWRTVNMHHHFVRVVYDIGRAAGVAFVERVFPNPEDQLTLFDR